MLQVARAVFQRRACVLQHASRTFASRTAPVAAASSAVQNASGNEGVLEQMRRIRNIGIAAHIDAGKTTATERMLFYSGFIPRCGEVHDGDTITDFMPQERERGITIKAAAISFGWAGHTMNLIDTPGHVDFTVEVERSFRVLDGAVLLYDAVNGVEAQSETVWGQARRYDVSRIAFANKMDREGASYELTAATMGKRLGAIPLCIHQPLGEAGSFAGFLNLLDMSLNAHDPAADKEGRTLWKRGLSEFKPQVLAGGKIQISSSEAPNGNISVPGRSDGNGPLQLNVSDLIDAAKIAREGLLERLADIDESVADAYLNAIESAAGPASSSVGVGSGFGVVGAGIGLDTSIAGLLPSDLKAALRRVVCTSGTRAVPLLCGSAYKFKGVQHMLDAVVDYLPSPLDRPPVQATSAVGVGSTHGKAALAYAASKAGAGASAAGSKPIEVRPDPAAPLRAIAFKVQNHPTRGPLVFFRVYSGVLSRSQPLLNVSTGEKERASKLLQMLADEQREVDAIAAGQIGAATGLKSVRTGDTLCLAADPSPALLPRLSLPQPVFTASLEVNGQSEQKALEEALLVLTREDPSLLVKTDADTGQLLVSGMGELHLDIACDRLNREYNVAVRLGRMMVAYRETVGMEAEAITTYDRPMGTKRMWAKVGLRIEPLPPTTESEAVESLSSSPCIFEQADGHIHCKLIGMGETESASPSASSAKPRKGSEPSASAAAAAAQGLKQMPNTLSDALREGVAACFGRGPLLGYPLVGLKVSLIEEECEVSPDTNAAAIKACIAKAFEQAVKDASGMLLEPIMAVEVAVPDAYVGDIINDISAQRRGRIKEVVSSAAAALSSSSSTSAGSVAVGGGSGKAVIRADVPLKSMVGYATSLRSRTGGEGSFAMEFTRYSHVGAMLQKDILADPYSA